MRKAIAIDFDGCLCVDAFPAIGEPNLAVINRAKAEQRHGAGLILWTCREGDLLQEAVTACASWGLTFDTVNESLPDWIEAFGNAPRKIGATEYWDDKAVRESAAPEKISDSLEAFLSFLRGCEQRYHMAEADEQEANAITNDIHHDLEFGKHTDEEILELGLQLSHVRRQRRRAKDAKIHSAPVLEWLDGNRNTVKALERLLGEVRRAERNTEGRIYTPRTKKETAAKR